MVQNEREDDNKAVEDVREEELEEATDLSDTKNVEDEDMEGINPNGNTRMGISENVFDGATPDEDADMSNLEGYDKNVSELDHFFYTDKIRSVRGKEMLNQKPKGMEPRYFLLSCDSNGTIENQDVYEVLELEILRMIFEKSLVKVYDIKKVQQRNDYLRGLEIVKSRVLLSRSSGDSIKLERLDWSHVKEMAYVVEMESKRIGAFMEHYMDDENSNFSMYIKQGRLLCNGWSVEKLMKCVNDGISWGLSQLNQSFRKIRVKLG